MSTDLLVQALIQRLYGSPPITPTPHPPGGSQPQWFIELEQRDVVEGAEVSAPALVPRVVEALAHLGVCRVDEVL